MNKRFYLISVLSFITVLSFGQVIIDDEYNKCGVDPGKKAFLDIYGDHWGYSYDSLLSDLTKWEASEFIQIQTIGQSTLERNLYELSITNPLVSESSKHRVYIHARTHPGEIQSFRVTEQMINFLSSDTELGSFLRENCIFHIIPMYNPDGVELEYSRQNANGIDIESNWGAAVNEIEVFHLRNRFIDLMLKENPIEIALNMHSAVACKRYFVKHHANGTSVLYTVLEEDFIEGVRSHFIEGIEPHDYLVTWSGGTPDQYPESWWWKNHQENVMALTYEDMNCESAGFYDKTAYANLLGILDYLKLEFIGTAVDFSNVPLQLAAYPNPFTDQIKFEWNNFDKPTTAFVTDMLGKRIRIFSDFELENGFVSWNGKDSYGNNVPQGMYLFHVVVENQVKSVKMFKQ
ncbi:MAG: T9SS type A sorting domain-containing protein [Bacteroidales bacterium]|nr:T9SS type A sorting domain-containing protein [Bacteroidales bacterium]MCF8405939.1 T9SS type A sorting domain-containing protein [Bacteroidales bacterium]